MSVCLTPFPAVAIYGYMVCARRLGLLVAAANDYSRTY